MDSSSCLLPFQHLKQSRLKVWALTRCTEETGSKQTIEITYILSHPYEFPTPTPGCFFIHLLHMVLVLDCELPLVNLSVQCLAQEAPNPSLGLVDATATGNQCILLNIVMNVNTENCMGTRLAHRNLWPKFPN